MYKEIDMQTKKIKQQTNNDHEPAAVNSLLNESTKSDMLSEHDSSDKNLSPPDETIVYRCIGELATRIKKQQIENLKARWAKKMQNPDI